MSRLFQYNLSGYSLTLMLIFLISASNSFASTIHLRTNCTVDGSTLSECYTNLSDINQKIIELAPNADNPLLIDIGPGTYPGQFKCTSVSHVSLRGSGRYNTIIGSVSADQNTMILKNCDQLSVNSLQVRGFYYTIAWTGTGTSSWTDVEVVGAGIGWYDDMNGTGCNPENTNHYWYSSKLTLHPYLTQSAAYVSNCGQHWIYGSELVSTSEPHSEAAFPMAGSNDVLRANSSSEIHVYGSVLRALSPSTIVGTVRSFRIATANQGEIHIHGTGIDALTEHNLDVEVFVGLNHGHIHANESAFNLKTGAEGSITRILKMTDNVHIHSPYLWQTAKNAPDITSINGADMVVVTDTADNQPHMLIYSTQCTSKWFDMVTKACH